jgi:ATP-binding cassette subfamily F protein 3
MILEDIPRSSRDLDDLIGDFFTNLIDTERRETQAICERIFGDLSKGSLITDDHSHVWVAEKLSAPLLMSDIELITDKEHQEGYTETPFGFDKFAFMNNNLIEEISDDMMKKKEAARIKEEEKQKREEARKKKKEEEAYEKHLQKMKQMRSTLPAVEVIHGKKHESFDIRLENINLDVPGKQLLVDTNFIMNRGRKYGLIGRNGIGKTTLLYAICRKEFKGMEKVAQVLLVEQEVQGDERNVLETILDTDTQRARLLREEEALRTSDKKEDEERLVEIYKELSDIESEKSVIKAKTLLNGLGFSQELQNRSTKSLSGGWRMRVSLAKVLFCEPEILLLDEPTNHLDLDAVMWLQDYLTAWDKTLLIVSHARDFLNFVCTDIIHFDSQQLTYYKGDYDNFEKQRDQSIEQSKKAFDTQQKKIAHVQDFIDKFRYNAKRASLVQSRVKYLEKLDKVEVIMEDPTTMFMFETPEKLRPPMIRIDDGSFAYAAGLENVIQDINFAVDMSCKVALLGANGVGKTTLLKCLTGELKLSDGNYFRNTRARVATFSQHHVDDLDITLSPFDQFIKRNPLATTETIRSHLSRFGIAGNLALRPMYLLSGGQKARVALASTAWGNPHVMIMDEPTNHLDIEAVDALVMALSCYEGGLIIVSHDQYFVSCICDQIWYIKSKKLKRFGGNFEEYRTALALNSL